MTPRQQQRFDRCIDYLTPIARIVEVGAGEVHWIAARNADPDQGPSYCYECGSAKVDSLNIAHPEHEYLLDGGWGSYESDCQEFCEECGKTLRTWLTDYGVSQELENWAVSRITLRGKHAAHCAYEIMRLLECALLDDYSNMPHLKEYEIDEIKQIQRDVHRLIKRIDAIRRRAAALLEKS